MALINCPECSNNISTKATSCPHCGYTIPVTPGLITLSRKKQIRASALKVHVFIDDFLIGSLRPGQEIEEELEPGKHSLMVKFGTRKVMDYHLKISAGEHFVGRFRFNDFSGLILDRLD